ncbi:hypothetical protein [Aneurinibacillus aneurinilyticus]|nr:hypothetical protein [Aneurinibacillus aneurinilyticus]
MKVIGQPPFLVRVNPVVEATKECLEFTLESLLILMSTNTTEKEKEDFIKSHTEIYFLAMKLTPLKWLESVIEHL